LAGGDASSENRPVPRSEVAAKVRSIMPRKPAPNPQGDEKMAARTVDVLTNYFPMQTASPYVYQYVVAFEPTIDSRTMRYAMLAAHNGVIGASSRAHTPTRVGLTCPSFFCWVDGRRHRRHVCL
jgi:hypothetical protein